LKNCKDVTELLQKELDYRRIKKHPYSGFDYLESWDVINSANLIFGHFGWDSSIMDVREINTINNDGKYEVFYLAKVRVTVTYLDEDGIEKSTFREDAAVGVSFGRKLSDCHDKAVKGAVSDAEKRALRKFGNQFGLPLYDDDKANVDFNPQEKDQGVNQENKDMTNSSCSDDIFDKLKSALLVAEKKAFVASDIKGLLINDQTSSMMASLKESNKDNYDEFIKLCSDAADRLSSQSHSVSVNDDYM